MSSSTQSASITELSNRNECPCCGNIKDLDKHHWQYQPVEVTVEICRDCHRYIHKDRRVREQGDDWQQECIERLAILDSIYNKGTRADLREQYNIPDSINC